MFLKFLDPSTHHSTHLLSSALCLKVYLTLDNGLIVKMLSSIRVWGDETRLCQWEKQDMGQVLKLFFFVAKPSKFSNSSSEMWAITEQKNASWLSFHPKEMHNRQIISLTWIAFLYFKKLWVDTKIITWVSQRDANRAQLAGCPPPFHTNGTWVSLFIGGGQNANKLCKKPFDKPTWYRMMSCRPSTPPSLSTPTWYWMMSSRPSTPSTLSNVYI